MSEYQDLVTSLRFNRDCPSCGGVFEDMDAIAAAKAIEQLESALAAEQEAHAATKRQLAEVTNTINASRLARDVLKQRAEAVEALIKGCPNEPTSLPLYAQPPIPPDVADYKMACEQKQELIYGLQHEVAELQRQLEAEIKNKKEFERDWLQASDEVLKLRGQLADDAFQKEVCTWAKSAGIFDANHLLKLQDELDELMESPFDETEMADLQLALILHAEQSGCLNLAAATRRKFEVVKSRTYGKPDERGVVRHISASSESNTSGTVNMTKAEYDVLSPKMKGYSCYMFGARPEAGAWLQSCPYNEDTQPAEFAEFQQGEFQAQLECMEMDD